VSWVGLKLDSGTLGHAVDEDDEVGYGSVSLLQVEAARSEQAAASEDSGSGSISRLQLAADRFEEAAASSETAAAIPLTGMSTTVRCLVALVIQYFVVYLFGLVARTCNQLCSVEKGPLQTALEKITVLANMLPMIGVLIIATQLRAEQLSQPSSPAKYGVPQWWSGAASLATVAAGVLAMAFQVLSSATAPAEADVAEGSGSLAGNFFAGCCMVATFIQYVGILVMVSGCTFMDEPFDIWLYRGPINVASAVACMINLTIQFFFVYLVLLVSGHADDLARGSATLLSRAAKAAAATQSLSPTFGVLIAAARLRSLDTSHPDGEVQLWAQTFSYMAVDGLLVHSVIAMGMAWLGGSSAKSRQEEDLDPYTGRRGTGLLLSGALGAIAMLFALLGVAGVVCCLLLFGDVRGSDATRPLSSVLTCTLVLALQHVVVHFLLCFLSTCGLCCGPARAQEAEAGGRMGIVDALGVAKDTNMVCPMLCVLFLAARTRAFLVDIDSRSQNWVESCMYACMWTSLLHLVLVLAESMVAGRAEVRMTAPQAAGASASSAGSAPKRPRAGAFFLAACQAVCMAFMYTTAVGIICGIFKMTPETVVMRGTA